MAYSPLGRGFLSGPDPEPRPRSPRTTGSASTRASRARISTTTARLVGRIEAIAREKGVTPSQLVLAWLLAQGDDVVPIPGTKRVAYLEENLGALGVRLSADDRRRIDEAMPPGAAKGGRYPDAQLRGVYL